ncbi:MAG TPA: hypothetical protein VFE50_24555 [Cyclobacteriaceae bacterium]|nr:hypothetical protein [Cyclobacteriaceae bacterium]
MDYNELTKKDLIEILENTKRALSQEPLLMSASASNQGTQNDLETLIGTIPFLLLNQEIFDKNQDIAEFAKKLNILIPSPEKKKREDIIGRIVSSIAKFDARRITELNLIIRSLKRSDIKRGKSNFFRDWENAIKEMKI